MVHPTTQSNTPSKERMDNKHITSLSRNSSTGSNTSSVVSYTSHSSLDGFLNLHSRPINNNNNLYSRFFITGRAVPPPSEPSTTSLYSSRAESRRNKKRGKSKRRNSYTNKYDDTNSNLCWCWF